MAVTNSIPFLVRFLLSTRLEMTYNVLLGAMIITVLGSVASTTHLSSTNVIVKAILQPTQINATKQVRNEIHR